MAYNTHKELYTIAGSNLQICFVNEHHQTSESSDSDVVSHCYFSKNLKLNSYSRLPRL
jgi:hypothetical protein